MRQALHAALALFLSVPIFSSPPPPRVPVVVELFTSEGCSDCPPADALLAELDRTQPIPEAQIIPIEEHVDYWNHDGWRDPFSSAAITERQVLYARRLGVSSPYTPQMVVAGRTEFVGSAGSRARAAIAAAARAPLLEVSLALVTASSRDASLHSSIRINQLPTSSPEAAEVFLAITEDALASNVSAGENSGRRLEHRAVLRKLMSAGRIHPGQSFSADEDTPIAPAWKRENLRVVAFVSGTRTGHIFGAATAGIGR